MVGDRHRAGDPRVQLGAALTLALLYDVHGNLAALEAVLDDARAAGARRFLLGGDYALFGPWPRRTLDALRALEGADWIRGNGERWTAAPDDAPDDAVVQGAIAACRQELGDGDVQALAQLAQAREDGGTLFCHASPLSDVRSFSPAPAANDGELLAGAAAPRVVFGHTHLPFRRHGERGTELVNPGSVGMPFDGDPRASYALLGAGGDVEHRRVEYDHAGAARTVRERFGPAPWADTVAARIESASFAPPGDP